MSGTDSEPSGTDSEPESQHDNDSESSSASTSSECDTGEMGSSYRKKRRISRYSNFVRGGARSVYKVRSKDLERSLSLSPSLEGVCQSCASGLSGIAVGFCKLRQQGTELKKRKSRLPHPKHPERDHYRDINAQNEWLRGNVFDAMGNYMFCHECIKKALKVSSQRLTRQRNVKRKVFQQPVSQMKKNEVDEQKLTSFVLMPDGIDTAFTKWWSSLPDDHTVNIRYPYERHGLCGRTSNSAKVDAKKEFLQFVDSNSQPNGRRLDSRNPTHYFLPRFKTISTPKKNALNYEEKKKVSLVCEFNRTQSEQGKDTISDFAASTWLKQERPKLAICPIKVTIVIFVPK